VRAARSHAEAESGKFAGIKNVDGRVSYRVPVGSVLRAALIAFARAVQPDLFPASYNEYDFDVSFIYLVLTADSLTQDFHADYNTFARAIVFLLPLDDAHGSTEFLFGGAVKKSDATAGDVVLFYPWLSHRGVATGMLRRCMYVSIRCLSRRRADDTNFAVAHWHAKTFEGSDYKDCAVRSMSEMEDEDRGRGR